MIKATKVREVERTFGSDPNDSLICLTLVYDLNTEHHEQQFTCSAMAKSQTENTEHTRRASIGYTYSELKSPIAVLAGAILLTLQFVVLQFPDCLQRN